MRGRSVRTALAVVVVQVAAAGAADRLAPLLDVLGIHCRVGAAGDRLDLWRELGHRRVSFSLRDEDLYRRYVRRVRVAAVSGRSGRVTISVPATAGGAHHQVELQVSGNALRYRGQGADGAWSAGLREAGFAGRVEYLVDRGRNRIGAQARWSRATELRQRARIEQFHRSQTDPDMNQYFWELLEPTFGPDITYDWRQHSWALETGWRVAVSPRTRLGLTLGTEQGRPRAEVGYVNTGSKDKLRGEREAVFRQELGSVRCVLAYEYRWRRPWRARADLEFRTQRWRGRAAQRDVPRSDSGVILDLVELGTGEGSQRGARLGIRTGWTPSARTEVRAGLAWARSSFDGDGAGTTPVLGFRLLSTLPIAHRAEADLSGRISTWTGSAEWRQRWGRARLRMAALAARAEVDARTRADVEMEFGLYVAPVRDRSRYRLALYRLHLAPEVRLRKHVSFVFRITQYLSSLTDIDRDAPLQPGPGVRTRGGRASAVGLILHL